MRRREDGPQQHLEGEVQVVGVAAQLAGLGRPLQVGARRGHPGGHDATAVELDGAGPLTVAEKAADHLETRLGELAVEGREVGDEVAAGVCGSARGRSRPPARR